MALGESDQFEELFEEEGTETEKLQARLRLKRLISPGRYGRGFQSPDPTSGSKQSEACRTEIRLSTSHPSFGEKESVVGDPDSNRGQLMRRETWRKASLRCLLASSSAPWALSFV